MSDDLDAMALAYHRHPRPGKISVVPTTKLANQLDLPLAYSPGVAAACDLICQDEDEAASLTARANLVAVISNGTAVLGLGSIGPLAAVVSVVEVGGELAGKSAVRPWMLAVGGLGIVFGLATWGYRVMETVGKRIAPTFMPDGTWFTIIGVVGDLEFGSLDDHARPALYLPTTQWPTLDLNLAIRTAGDPAALAARWSQLLARPVGVGADGSPAIALESGALRFAPDPDGRGEGVSGIDFVAADPARALDAARERGFPGVGDHVRVCGTRIRFTDAAGGA